MQKLFFSLMHSLKAQLFLMLLLLLIGCTGCSLWGDNPGKPALQRKVTPTPAKIGLGVQSCPPSMSNLDMWKKVVSPAADAHIEHVLCGNLLDIPTIQAIVTARHGGSDAVLDIFIYSGDITASSTPIFSLKGLLHGDARISNYNTLLTAQEDRNSLYNKGLTNQWTADLCREYKWSDAAGTMVQVAFPGIFPDVTRYQGEFEQDEVNNAQGFQQWRLSAITTTQRFCERILKWPSDTPVKVVSGSGKRDIHAVVQVKQSLSNVVTIKLDRLERNENGGLWEVIDAQTDGLTLTVPHSDQPLTSPTMVTGSGGRGTIGTVQVLDHEYNASGESEAWGTTSANGKVLFSKSVSYTLSFQGGTQEGMVVLLVTAPSSNGVIGIAVTKVLLSD